ncbi:MAG TPA: threonine/serine dehydratase [Planctomycetaceae bacterium]|nr:threonine/serine dehydratase [Planctomycetaceae bacterium]
MSSHAETVFSVDLILQAQRQIRGLVHRTPLAHSVTLSEHLGVPVYLKLECLQKTGSFKPRGAFFKLLSLSADEKAAGVVAVSGGNHAQGVAYAARQLGLHATICMPASTPANYLDATRGYGAEVVLCEHIAAAFARAEQLRQQGLTLVHPFDDPHVAAGQGTVGLEILEDLPDASRVYVSIGGGGLIAGMATVMKAAHPGIRIFGCETEGADAMAQAVAAGKIVELAQITSIARTLGSPKVCDFTFDAVRKMVEEVIVVSDAAAFAGLEQILERTKILVEPAASCCLAAAEKHRGTFAPGEKIVLLMCGGNVSLADVCGFRQRFGG